MLKCANVWLLGLLLFNSFLIADEKSNTQSCLHDLSEQTADFSQTQDEVQVLAKTLSMQDCKNAFGNDAFRLLFHESAIYPIQLAVHNNGKTVMKLSSNEVSLPLVKPEVVEQTLCPEKEKWNSMVNCWHCCRGDLCGFFWSFWRTFWSFVYCFWWCNGLACNSY